MRTTLLLAMLLAPAFAAAESPTREAEQAARRLAEEIRERLEGRRPLPKVEVGATRGPAAKGWGHCGRILDDFLTRLRAQDYRAQTVSEEDGRHHYETLLEDAYPEETLLAEVQRRRGDLQDLCWKGSGAGKALLELRPRTPLAPGAKVNESWGRAPAHLPMHEGYVGKKAADTLIEETAALLDAPSAAAAPQTGLTMETLSTLAASAGRGDGLESQSVNARFEDALAVNSPAAVHALAAETPLSLAQKAALFEERTRREHRPWFGLILARMQDEEGRFVEYSSLNDAAIWTGNYVASQAFRYAATGEADALEAMEESLAGLHALHEVTGVPGLPARVLLPADYAKDHPLPRSETWHEGKEKYEGWLWRGDFSHDQMDGWLFGVSAAWPYIQDPVLKDDLSEDLRQIGLHVIRNGMRVRGPDTFLDFRANHYYQERWPKLLRGLPLPPWRGGDAMHGLHLMRVCASLTGDPELLRYYRDKMVLNEELDLKLLAQPMPGDLIAANRRKLQTAARAYYGTDIEVRPEALRASVASNLSHMALYDLVRLEGDPALKDAYREAFRKEHAEVAREGNTWWNFLYASQFPEDPRAVQDGVESLRRYPTRAVLGKVKNSEDPSIAKYKGVRADSYAQGSKIPWAWFTDEPLPFERRVLHAAFPWQHNPYLLDGGSDLRQGSGAAYLAAYWLGRANGFIGSED